MRVRMLYFASLRDVAGCDQEALDVEMISLSDLYEAVRSRHGFAMPRERLRVARNGAFARWEDVAADGDEIAFIPPVSGG
jgi:molybdopterin synthase sulfur carrier subunit